MYTLEKSCPACEAHFTFTGDEIHELAISNELHTDYIPSPEEVKEFSDKLKNNGRPVVTCPVCGAEIFLTKQASDITKAPVNTTEEKKDVKAFGSTAFTGTANRKA